MEELFRRQDLLVRNARTFGTDICFVTFDSYSDTGSLDRPCFGESYFQARGIDAVHLLSQTNNWYLYDYSPEAFAAVAEATRGYKRVIAYGSSMGAYAAIRFGRLVGAQVAIAMSPQFSINPEVAPHELRWKLDAQLIDFSLEESFGPFVDKAYIFYDPLDLDRRHVDCYRERTQVEAVPIVSGGHPCTTLLAETGLLQSAVLEIADGSFDRADFARRLRHERRATAQLYYNISSNAVGRSSRAVPMARIAAMLRPDSVAFQAHLGALLVQAGAFDEARIVLQKALDRNPEDLNSQYRMSEFYESIGDLDTAVAMMDRMVLTHPQSRYLKPRLDYLLEEQVRVRFEALIDRGALVSLAVHPPQG